MPGTNAHVASWLITIAPIGPLPPGSGWPKRVSSQPDWPHKSFRPHPLRQFNLGERSRIAGRDYYESRIPDSIKVYLATTSSERLDDEAIDNERLFYYRFGVDVPRAAREQVLAVKRQHGFTDAECRWLRRSGQFRISREGARLVPDRLVPAAAWLYALTLAFFFVSSLLIINLSAVPPWKQSLGSAVILALWLGALWIINRLFWAPWRWIRKLQHPA